MASSLHEQVVARVQLVLLVAETDAEDRVQRGRTDTPAVDDTPNTNVRRGEGAIEPFADQIDASSVQFTTEHWASGDEWEADADALHMQSHAAIVSDTVLAELVSGLRCIATDTQGAAAQVPIGRVSATYRAQALVSQRDLTRHFNT